MSTVAHPLDVKPATVDGQPMMLRLRVSVRRAALTRQLADGADPAAAPELALRARQLTSVRERRLLAKGLRSAIGEARQPPLARMHSTISRRAVLDAVDALDVLVKRLHSPVPVTTRGMALAHRLLTDGSWSPLYRSADPGALRRLVILTTAALDASGADAPPLVLTPQDRSELESR